MKKFAGGGGKGKRAKFSLQSDNVVKKFTCKNLLEGEKEKEPPRPLSYPLPHPSVKLPYAVVEIVHITFCMLEKLIKPLLFVKHFWHNL